MSFLAHKNVLLLKMMKKDEKRQEKQSIMPRVWLKILDFLPGLQLWPHCCFVVPNRTSFESTDNFWMVKYLVKSLTALLRPEILALNTLIYTVCLFSSHTLARGQGYTYIKFRAKTLISESNLEWPRQL